MEQQVFELGFAMAVEAKQSRRRAPPTGNGVRHAAYVSLGPPLSDLPDILYQ